MMKNTEIKFSEAELKHIQVLIDDSLYRREYWGPKDQWFIRTDRISKKVGDAIAKLRSKDSRLQDRHPGDIG
jgi:hypothetical protein